MNSIEKAIKLKNELDVLRPLKKDDEMRIMQKFKLDWNYHSNNLEGNTLTYGETKALILFGITAQGKPLKDHFEITGHDKAIEWVMDVVKEDRPLTEAFIRELHKLILKESYEVDAISPEGKPTKKTVKIGEYKSGPNHVKTKTGEIFRFASKEETPALMTDLVEWYREKSRQVGVNPILLAAEFHYRFIIIHPFDDGNGRTARILMNFILMRFGYPPVIIKTEDKENYFAALRQADAGLLEPFIEYISRNLNHSLEIMIKGAKGESIEETDDIYKEIALIEQKLQTVGQPIEITKSKENIMKLFDGFIYKLIEDFHTKGKLLARHYLNSVFYIALNPGQRYLPEEEVFQNIKDYVSEDTRRIEIHYNYETFNRKLAEGQEYRHFSHIEIDFAFSSYRVKTWRETLYEKPYGELLTDQEIKEAVNAEIKEHTKIIDAIIAKLKE